MNGELSQGLPRLITRDNQILRTHSNEAILLRGVNRSGLEYSEPGAEGVLTSAAIIQAVLALYRRHAGLEHERTRRDVRGGRTMRDAPTNTRASALRNGFRLISVDWVVLHGLCSAAAGNLNTEQTCAGLRIRLAGALFPGTPTITVVTRLLRSSVKSGSQVW